MHHGCQALPPFNPLMSVGNPSGVEALALVLPIERINGRILGSDA